VSVDGAKKPWEEALYVTDAASVLNS
jgi:hypothetical protein